MDGDGFDRLARSVSGLLSRRAFSGVFALSALALPKVVEAKKKRKKRKKKKKAKFNDFGCVNVGNFCKNNSQCCSGICQGKKGKKKCQAHDESTCQAGQDLCIGVGVACVTSTGDPGVCTRTTGEAGYCFGGDGQCFECSKDADCVPFCGAQAACIVCPGLCAMQGLQTACLGPAPDSCTFPPP